MCYEHSASEGVAVIQLMERMLQEATSPAPAPAPALPTAASASNGPPRLLSWNVDSVTRANIQVAARTVDRWAESHSN